MQKPEFLKSKILRLLLLAVVVGTAIFLISRNIDATGKILITIIGFGAVILIHEFGHFIVAKLSDIKVEAFSIGFSPVLAGIMRTENGYRFRILPGFFDQQDEQSDGCLCSFTIGGPKKPGETEYRIGLIPFGGFVKMLGQEDTKEVEETDDPRSYANKPVSIRMAVIAAGVTFNAISAIIVFVIAFLIGIQQIPPVVGGVRADSPAAQAGIQAGDEILEVAGKSDHINYRDVVMGAALSGKDESVPLKIRRRDGAIVEISLVAKQMQTPLGDFRFFGLEPPVSLTVAKVSDSDILFEKTGLMPGDVIKSVNGTDVDAYWQVEEIIESLFEPTVTVLADRSGKLVKADIALDLTATSNYNIKSESDLWHTHSMVPRLRITGVLEEKTSPLKSGDIILSIGTVENPTFMELRQVTAEHEDKELNLKILRSDAKGQQSDLTVTVIPKRPQNAERALIGIGVALDAANTVVAKTIVTENGPEPIDIPRGAVITSVNGNHVSDFYQVIQQLQANSGKPATIDYRLDEITGSVTLQQTASPELITVRSRLSESVPLNPMERLYKASSPMQAIKMGYRRTVAFIAEAYVTLRRLFGGLVSPKNFMGPIGIFKTSYQIVAQKPIIYYVYFLGLISAFIAVLNSAPVLPFDGGHILFMLIEKIKGSPVSERIQAAVLYAGLGVVGVFFLYVTFNDIIR